MNRRQWHVGFLALGVIGLSALLPRDIYGRLYPLFSKPWQYDPWPHLFFWGAILLAAGLVMRSFSSSSTLLLGQRVALRVGGGLLVLSALFPVNWYEVFEFAFVRFRQFDHVRQAFVLVMVAGVTICAVSAFATTRAAQIKRWLLGLWLATSFVLPLMTSPISSPWYAIFTAPILLVLIGIVSLIEWVWPKHRE